MRSTNCTKWLFLVAFFACTVPVTAIAGLVGYTKDQEQADWAGASTIDGDFWIAQSFKPSNFGVSVGPLAAIEVDIWKSLSAAPASGVFVEVRNFDTDTSKPGGTVLGTSQTILESTLDTVRGTWSAFYFAGVPVVAETSYAFVLQGTVAEDTISLSYDESSAATGYTRGDYYSSSDDGASWTKATDPTWRDVQFRTYHTPEPGTLVGLLSMGAMGIVGYGWRKRRRR